MSVAPDEFDRYIEPFAGSAAFFFAIKPARAVLADFNADLVNALQQIQHHPRRLQRSVALMPRQPDFYYWMRDSCAPTKSFERAERFIYLNRNCFNGVYRTNKAGKFNVPFGAGMGGVPSSRDFYRCSVALRAAEVRCQDFRATLEDVRSDDFVYVDPPYLAQRPHFGEYGYGSFDEEDIDDLVDLLRAASEKGAKMLLSYGSNSRLTGALTGWGSVSVPVRRDVAAAVAKRDLDRGEVLASNLLPVFEASGVRL